MEKNGEGGEGGAFPVHPLEKNKFDKLRCENRAA